MTFKMKEEAQTITVYNFRADTLEFIGAGDAYIPPHTGLPAYCTDIKPSKIPEGMAAIFNSSKSTWSLVEDHREKTVYDTATRGEIYITELGSVPENTTSMAPDGQYQKWNGKIWVKDEIAERIAKLTEATIQKNSLMQMANGHVSPLQDAVDLAIATDEEAKQLTSWKNYRVLLNRVDCSKPVWPEVPTI